MLENSGSSQEGRADLLPLTRDIDGDTYSIAESDCSGDENVDENHLAEQHGSGSSSSAAAHSTTVKAERLKSLLVLCIYSYYLLVCE